MFCLLLKESRPSLLLEREVATFRKTGLDVVMKTLSPDSAPDAKTLLQVTLVRPLPLLFTELIVMMVASMGSVTCALFYLTAESLLLVFEALCSSIPTYTNPKLKGHQVIASPDFVKDIEHLILCLPPGPKSAISVQSTSRCGPSPKDSTTPLPTDKISMHQLGYAVDINVILPNGDYCNGECTEKAYCAFHPLSVANCSQPKYMNQPQNERNTIIDEFLECAGSEGLEVGAGYNDKKADPVHFERQVPKEEDKAEFIAYIPQMKQYCLGQCPNET
ncbi:hypothetical protein LTR66_002410 [Elasticomyces elasticus]|nr:hypothetical protein LTR66_002410 [Elasticomyces elasticus]